MTAKDSEPSSMEEDPPAQMEESLTNIPISDPAPAAPSSPSLNQTMTMPDLTNEIVMKPKAVSLEGNDCSPVPSSPAQTSPVKPLVETSPNASHIPSLSPAVQTTTIPNFPSEALMEPKAISMTNKDCSPALSSPTEASPAKPAVTSPTTFDGTVVTGPDTSHIASASDSLTSTGTSLVSLSEAPLSSLPVLPFTTFGNQDNDKDFPNVLTFKGVSLTLENNSVWKQFHSCGTEMILTKQGRRMFPYCRYRLAGLDPDRMYSLVLAIVPSDQHKYRWNHSRWEITGPAEHQPQGLIRAFAHHNSPCRGSEWMGSLVSFYKLKLTNNPQDQDGHIILHSMQRYIPKVHVIPVPDGEVLTPDKPLIMGPECITFTFPQTEFMSVTTYQNFRITQLKINHNPFAKGFREDGNNSRLQRITPGAHPMVKLDTQSTVLIPADINGDQGSVDLSTKKELVPPSASSEQETRLVLKPIMSTSANKDDQYVPCIRGNHALGELVLVQKCTTEKAKEEQNAATLTQKICKGFRFASKTLSRTTKFKTSTPGSTLGYHKRKRRKRINRRWANSRGKLWKANAASPTVVYSPSLTVAMQPELDDVEGLLFVSFTSKEALDVHVGDEPSKSSSLQSAVTQTTQMESRPTVEEVGESDEEKITRFEAILLQNLNVLKHRQVIHPVLQEVGLKLTSIDPAMPIDLHYLGVHLPLPPPDAPKQDEPAPGEEGLSFVSRTGKTNDMTKIKGWRNKFIKKDTSLSNSDGSQKNLSAFCSNMLDEYLENEAQYISERANAFSTNPEGSVSYQLPTKSSSYVKTLDSVLKHRKASSKLPWPAVIPRPLSHKSVPRSATSVQAEASSAQQSKPAPLSGHNSSSSPKLPSSLLGQNQSQAQKPPGFTKCQFSLMKMELGAFNEGLHRTELTSDRLSVALSAIVTKQMHSSQILKLAKYPPHKAKGPTCGQDFCRLGCVCFSLQCQEKGPHHCRRPECMFGCICSKPITYMDHAVQLPSGCHAKKLWRRDLRDEDKDPLSVPKRVPVWVAQAKGQKRSFVHHPAQQIREEDKSPVYKYFESLMTCARVREFCGKPSPKVQEPKIPDPESLDITDKPLNITAESLQKTDLISASVVDKTERTSQGSTGKDSEGRMKIEIQSSCTWDKDRKMILETLYQRMSQNKLVHRFRIGPYRIHPLAKISMRKPSGTVVTYRVHISRPSKPSDNDADGCNDSDGDNPAGKKHVGNAETELDNSQVEIPEGQIGVIPFLSGVMPAGSLTAKPKPVGQKANGLIQVNGKSYNQARLLLGNMGSLHPANRLAAYCTGRLKAPADISLKNLEEKHTKAKPAGISVKYHGKSEPTKTTMAGISLKNLEKSEPKKPMPAGFILKNHDKIPNNPEKLEPTQKTNPPGALHITAAGTVIPSVIIATKTTDLKTQALQPVKLLQPETLSKGCLTLSQVSTNSTSVTPVLSFIAVPTQQTVKQPEALTQGPVTTNSSSVPPVLSTMQSSAQQPVKLVQPETEPIDLTQESANSSSVSHVLSGIQSPGQHPVKLVQPEKLTTGPIDLTQEFTNSSSANSVQDFFKSLAQHNVKLLQPDTGTEDHNTSTQDSANLSPANSLLSFIQSLGQQSRKLFQPEKLTKEPIDSSSPNLVQSFFKSLAQHPAKLVQSDTKPLDLTQGSTNSTSTNPVQPFSPEQQPVKLFHSDTLPKGPITLSQESSNSSSINPVQSFIKNQLSSFASFHNSSASSPVSLTVSPSLKSPSFLEQSGTYSFRICPPANQDTAGKNPPGVSLPGGFTLVQIPKTRHDKPTQQPQPVRTTNMAAANKAPPPKPGLLNMRHPGPDPKAKWHEFDFFARAKELTDMRSTQPGVFTRQMFDEKMRSVRNERLNAMMVDSHLDNASEDFSSDLSDFDIEVDDDEEPVDIETVEEVRQEMAIAKMKEAVRQALLDARDTSGFGLISKLAMSQLEEQIDEGSRDRKRRSIHTVLERQRRSELRELFHKLESVLMSDPKAPRLLLLSQAIKEIQKLAVTAKILDEQKRKLEEEQLDYLKKLSVLSGKPHELIKHKLNEIYERQKERERASKLRPFFSNLLQSRAIALEAASPTQSKPESLPQLDSFTDDPHLHPLVAAALKSVHKKPSPIQGPLALLSQAMLNFNGTPPRAEKQPRDPEDTSKDKSPQVGETVGELETESQEKTAVSTPNPPTDQQPQQSVVTATPPVTTAQVEASSPVSSSSAQQKQPTGVPLEPSSFPLIRSKTGRIILPASLKPIGQGYYTLTFLKPQEDGAEGGASEPDPSKNKTKSPPELKTIQTDDKDKPAEKTVDKPVDKPTKKIVDKTAGETVEPTKSQLQPSVILTKPLYVPLVDLKDIKGIAAGGKETQGAARLNFQHICDASVLIKPKPDPDSPSPTVKRGRGRPRKQPFSPLSESIKHKESSNNQTPEVKLEDQPVDVSHSQAEDTPPAVKRGRGRPRKEKRNDESIQMWRPPPNLVKRSPRRSGRHSPGRFSDISSDCDLKAETPEQGLKGTSRPLTRGALGKDFPSAKKRSWIDVEKELDLEPEVEYE